MAEHNDFLADRIMAQIARETRRRLVIKTAAFGVLLASSVALMVSAGFADASAAYGTGFFAFFSLIFTDFRAVMADFSDLAFSLLDSFPVFPSIALLAGAFSAVWSAAGFASELALFRRLPRLSPARS